MVPLHPFDMLSGNAGSVAMNPSKQEQEKDATVLLQLELTPHIPGVSRHSSMSAKIRETRF